MEAEWVQVGVVVAMPFFLLHLELAVMEMEMERRDSCACDEAFSIMGLMTPLPLG